MRLIYGTTNKAKIDFMKRRIEPLGIELLSLSDIGATKLDIDENGNSPLDNAKIKALAYYRELKMPVFSCDSGLYIDGLDDARQPGVNIRGIGDYMNDDETTAYYSKLAAEFGGSLTARYKNAIVLVLDEAQVYEYMGEDISGEPFLIVSKPHSKTRKEGFPIDPISVHIESGKYYYDIDGYTETYGNVDDGFAAFFSRIIEGELGMKIRTMTIADYDHVYSLWLNTPNMGLNNIDDSRDGIAKYLARNPNTCFVAEKDGTIFGVILCGHDGRRGYIHHTAVAQDEQRSGIGTALLNAAISALDGEGISKAALVVFGKNEKGNAFWEKQGFITRQDLVYRNKAIADLTRIDT